MNDVRRELDSLDYGQQISKVIESKLVDQYGVNGYRSILKTIIEKSKKQKKRSLQILICFQH